MWTLANVGPAVPASSASNQVVAEEAPQAMCTTAMHTSSDASIAVLAPIYISPCNSGVWNSCKLYSLLNQESVNKKERMFGKSGSNITKMQWQLLCTPQNLNPLHDALDLKGGLVKCPLADLLQVHGVHTYMSNCHAIMTLKLFWR
jgi:hypothetical protein